MRNPFVMEARTFNESVLMRISVSDLTYVGVITLQKELIGFVKDPAGNFYALKLGQRLGLKNEKIVSILDNKIIFTDGSRFTIVK